MPPVSTVDHFFKYWLIALLGYCAWIYYLSSGPVSLPLFLHFEGADKILHAGAYGMMAAMAWQVLHRSYWGACAWCALYGASDEWHQSFTGRNSDIADWAADVIGATLMLVTIYIYISRQEVAANSTNTQLS